MSKAKDGILGGFSGKVGTVVGRKWRGQYIMSAYKVSKNPRTQAQQDNRGRFAALGNLSGRFSSVAKMGLEAEALRMGTTARGRFISLNWPALSRDLDGTWMVSYPEIKTAQGPLANVVFDALDPQHGVMRIPFTAIAGEGDPRDEVVVFLYCPEAGYGVMETVVKAAEEIEVAIPTQFENNKVQAWGFVRKYCNDAIPPVSNSTYIGEAIALPLI